MNAALISSLPEKHNFDSKQVKDAPSNIENEISTNDENKEKSSKCLSKEEPPSLHMIASEQRTVTKQQMLNATTTTTSATAVTTATHYINTSTTGSNVKAATTRVVPLVYIQAPANIKVPTSLSASVASAKTNPQIIVNANTQFQISTLGTKLKTSPATMSSVVLSQANSKSQPIILQKTSTSPNAQTLIPVSVATSTGTKQTFAYLGTIIKPPPGKGTDNQLVVPTTHLPADLVNHQKLVLTPMTMPKLAPRLPANTCSTTSLNQPKLSSLILPMTLSTQIKNQSVINFKISNSQFQSDPKGAITVLCDNKSPNSDVSDRDKQLHINADKTEKKDDAIAKQPNDKKDKPNTKSELSEKVYELSISENPQSKSELSYTISIPEEDNKKYFKSKIRRSVSTETKEFNSTSKLAKEELGNVPSIVSKPEPQQQQVYRKSVHEVSILKKCNLKSLTAKTVNDSASDQKTENENDGTITTAATTAAITTTVTTTSTEKKVTSEVRRATERRRKSQYTYLRDFDEVVVTSGNAWENKNNEKIKQFQSAEITFTKLSNIDNSETKENNTVTNTVKKSMDDFIEIELVKQDLPQFSTDDDQDIKTALKWRDGIGFLPGSKLKFHINEFGIIEMLVGDDFDKFKSIKKEDESFQSDEILHCSVCGCYGMPAEFISQNYCSKTCKITGLKAESKRAFLQEVKAKRKKKKLAALMQKNNPGIDALKYPQDLQINVNALKMESDEENSDDAAPGDNKVSNYPWQTGKKGFSWSKYLEHIKAKAAPVKLFKEPFPYAKNGFRSGMKLEGIDPQHPSYFCVMSVAEVQGYRIRLHFDGYPENYDFWVNADSMDIFPVGWCEKYNHILHPPPSYTPSSFNWSTYLKQCRTTAAPRHLFTNRAGNSVCPNGFRLGMKLEAVDKKNASLVCVATVADQMDNRFLVHFDSWDDIYDYWADPSSPYIHPVGWCDKTGHNLTPPNDYPSPETFTWEKYLKETKATAAPVRAFKQRPSKGFKRDMRLECVDKRVPSLIRVATVEDVREHQVRVRFDGWPNKYSFWIDDDSPDVHPAGWCQKTGHRLESPLTPEDVFENFECPTVGCRGYGHVQGSKYTTHNTSKHCPYSDENLAEDFVLPDRLTLTDQQCISESVVPISREPKDKFRTHRMGRPPKIRRLTETSIKPEWPLDEDLNEPTNLKRKLSISSRASSPVFNTTNNSTTNETRLKLLTNDYGACPSQQVLAKHSKILNEIMTSANASQDPRMWGEDEVADFVSSLPSCKEHAKLFISHKIDGEAFLMLTQRDLVDILKFKLGPAIKLYNSIVLLRQNCTFYTS